MQPRSAAAALSSETAIAVRVHITNVTGAGLGAVQLVKSLLPALETSVGFRVEEIYLPASGELSQYRRITPGVAPVRYRRFAPNAVSRLLECTIFGRRFDGETPLLILGDLPLNARSTQILFVQTPLLAGGHGTASRLGRLKYQLARLVFMANFRFVSRVIVQTAAMRSGMEADFRQTRGSIMIIPQPAPEWLIASGLRRDGRVVEPSANLHLFYPAADYPHKNHRLLADLSGTDAAALPLKNFTLTLADKSNPNRRVPWITCVGELRPAEVLDYYRLVDAIVVLSKAESYGLPLVEAMWVGLPIVCPDLPYARALCGDGAIYFEPTDINSLAAAILNLRDRIRSGWWPDWTAQLRRIPLSWEQVARAMLNEVAKCRALHDGNSRIR